MSKGTKLRSHTEDLTWNDWRGRSGVRGCGETSEGKVDGAGYQRQSNKEAKEFNFYLWANGSSEHFLSGVASGKLTQLQGV